MREMMSRAAAMRPAFSGEPSWMMERRCAMYVSTVCDVGVVSS